MNRQELIKTLEELKEHAKHLIELNKYESYWQGKTEAYVNAIALAKQLDEPKITDEQAWDKVAEAYPESPQSLRNTLDNAVFGKAGEPQKPVVPQFVAEWFEENKVDLEFPIWELCVDSYGSDTEQGMLNWIQQSENKPIETLIRMKDGYVVEKEQFYEVVFREDESDRYLLMKLGEKCYEIAPESENDGYRTQCFTESEIKAIDERYWSFAVPVEEVTNAVLSAFAKRRLEQEEDAE